MVRQSAAQRQFCFTRCSLAPLQCHLCTRRLFRHLAEVGDKYSAPDQASASSSHDGTSADKGSEDGEASAMEQDNAQSRSAIHPIQ